MTEKIRLRWSCRNSWVGNCAFQSCYWSTKGNDCAKSKNYKYFRRSSGIFLPVKRLLSSWPWKWSSHFPLTMVKDDHKIDSICNFRANFPVTSRSVASALRIWLVEFTLLVHFENEMWWTLYNNDTRLKLPVKTYTSSGHQVVHCKTTIFVSSQTVSSSLYVHVLKWHRYL